MQVFIVNGNPRAGKDTLVEMVSDHLHKLGVAARSFSSIEPVRAALAALRVDVSKKTEADRLVLAEVGAALERHSGFRTKACLRFIMENPAPVKFLYVREVSILNMLKAYLEQDGKGVTVRTIIVSNPNARPVTSNASDADVRKMPADVSVVNDANLEELDLLAATLARMIANPRCHVLLNRAPLVASDFMFDPANARRRAA